MVKRIVLIFRLLQVCISKNKWEIDPRLDFLSKA